MADNTDKRNTPAEEQQYQDSWSEIACLYQKPLVEKSILDYNGPLIERLPEPN